MHKTLSIIIMIFLLGNNVVWGLDFMDIEQGHEKQAHSHDGAIEVRGENQETDSCDHCCHVNAHYLGILANLNCTGAISASKSVTTVTSSHTSWAYQPPLPPPNV